VYKDDKSTSAFHDMVRNLATATKSASPTPFHHLLATLAKEGRLMRLYTQNVDGIDTSLPPLATDVPLGRKGPWPKTVQLHGCLEKMVCTKCHELSELDPALFDGPIPPPCSNCVETDGVRTQHAGKRSHGVGRLRPRMVLYSEHNPDDEAIGAVAKADLRARPDALIVVGTTLKVPGVKRIVKEMCGVVRDRKDGCTIWINSDPPPLGKDYEWDLVVQGPCDAVASRAAMPKWNDVFEKVSDEQIQRVKQESGTVEVVVQSPPKKSMVDKLQGVVTPMPSPRLLPQQKADAKLLTKGATTAKAKHPITAATKKTKVATKSANAAKGKKTTAVNSKKNPPFKKPIPGAGIMISFKQSKPVAQASSTSAKSSKDTSDPNGQAQLKIRKPEVSQPMQPVSPSAARNNSNPPFQPPGPRKTYVDAKGVPLSVSIPVSPRIGESAEDRNRIVTPPGTIPRGFDNILN
jgi:NAD-dependent histone deacetylase SIR2